MTIIVKGIMTWASAALVVFGVALLIDLWQRAHQ